MGSKSTLLYKLPFLKDHQKRRDMDAGIIWYSIKEYADKFQVSVQTVYTRIKKGELIARNHLGRIVVH